MRFKRFRVFAALAGIAMILAGCGQRAEEAGKTLQVKGSNTMLQLGQAWAEEYNYTSKIKVSISGEGSGVGISAVINGTTDIAMSSR